LLTEAAAAVAGFEGTGALESLIGKKKAEGEAESNDADAQADDSQS
jgi:hypothetical protein